MSEYKISIINQSVRRFKWGEFFVKKEFIVTKIKNKNSKNSKNNEKSDISGFILQHVIKESSARVLCKDNKLRKINDITKFTNNNVKFMNDSYYELFPVINGESVYADKFQNGAILRYEYDEDENKWYANNNPPTQGKIIQIGRVCFIEADKIDVENIIEIIENKSNGNKSNKNIKIDIFDIKWNMDPTLPSNGLPYSISSDVTKLFDNCKSNIIEHKVLIEWDGTKLDKNIINNKINNANSKNDTCSELNENNSISNLREKYAKTIVHSIFNEIKT